MVVKVADGVENGADDGDGIVLGRHALCEGTVKGSPPVVSSVFCARLEALRDRRCW